MEQNTNSLNDFYCSEKFWWMNVNLEKRVLSSCCSADSIDIDMQWVKENPGDLFNHPELVADRQQMLANKPCSSCHNTCWSQEEKGLESKRISFNRTIRTHTNIKTRPELLNIHMGSTCNMSCTYCGVQNSSKWLDDITKNGAYPDTPGTRFTSTNKDLLIMKIGQKALTNSNPYLTLLEDIKTYSDAKHMDLTGGEPFLHNNLETVISGYPGIIRIHTGLGVDTDRLEKILNKLPLDRLEIVVSVENINDYYEFNRYGNTYERFLRNLALLEKYKLPIILRSTLSNLTIFGYKDFLNKFAGYDLLMFPCVDVSYLALHVIDDHSREKILNTDYGEFTSFIHNAIIGKLDTSDRLALKAFVLEFAQRRNLKLDIFPDTFIQWVSQ